ncbi:MAG: type I-E CRISPR-associated protein Cas7/Cse4/CasC [Deltaproteobacteria bacterium]|nr:type I-E CRISPR-associated protein Cas7/Cse4/CasC [Deltaproteobacteria bacterium]
MKLELHILQNFAPSNLNRDDTGSPKDCELGGVRRARISSQCLKRSIRETFETHGLLTDDERAARTKRLVLEVSSRVIGRLHGKEGSERAAHASPADDPRFARVSTAVTSAIVWAGLKANAETSKTEYLLFLPVRALDALAEVVEANLDKLAPGESPSAAEPAADEGAKSKGKPKSKKAEKSEAKEAADPEVRKQIVAILEDAARTPELALFGRMIADAPGWNVEASCQVAHAISTHRVSMEFDFYTAIDDLKPDDTAGSDMMGTIPFNSACFYRYLVVDVGDLQKNLGGDAEATAQARRTVEALVKAAVLAIPTGKQNSMAAQNLPSFVLASVTDGAAPRSLANAFAKPVRPPRDGDLVHESVVRLAKYASAMDAVYGDRDRRALTYVALDPEETLAADLAKHLPKTATDGKTLDQLAATVVGAALGAPT